MRILHINLEKNWGGGERQTLLLMQELQGLGYENELLTNENSPLGQKVSAAGFKVKRIAKPYLFHGPGLKDYDLVQTNEARGLQLAAFWKFWHQRPIVHTRRVSFKPGNNLFTRYKYKKIDSMVVISNKIAQILRDWGYQENNIYYIPSAVSLPKSINTSKLEELKKRFSGWQVIGNVASLVDAKDHDTLLDVASIIAEQDAKLLFVILGDGPLLDYLQRKARQLGLKNVVFEGHQEDPHSYLPIFDLFLMTSKQEGLCSSILDAFAYKVPVVATNAGGIPELVKNERSGLLTQVGQPGQIAQAICRMLEDEKLRYKCVQTGQKLLQEEFKPESMAHAYDQVYKKLLGH
jgi:glycosyltransferase involved in cell wall biosynthesis